jgi:DNA-binding NtrC family response regulator
MAKSVLIVDDDPNILDTAKDILEEAGYFVAIEGTAAGAIQYLMSTPADVAIFDFNLPDSTGVALAVEAKRMCPKMKIILLTGEDQIDLSQAKASISSILIKPVSPAILINTIQNS